MDTAGELHQATLLNRKHLDLDVRAVIATAAHRLFAGRPHAVNRVASPVWNSSCGSRDLSMITDLRKDLGIEIIEEENGYHEIVNQNVARSHSPVPIDDQTRTPILRARIPLEAKMQNLEAETLSALLMKGTAVSLEKTLLVLSGLRTDEEILSYERKVGRIFERFLNQCGPAFLSHQPKPPPYLHRDVAACLFDYLWMSKPRRFGVHFLLAEVIDAQLHSEGNRAVGTCIGLTSLYSVLALRAGLNLSILVSSDHVRSRLRAAEHVLDMDHTDPQGFDCTSADGFHEFPLWTLTANTLNSRGLRHEAKGRFQEAKADYESAIGINPQYANAYNNRGNMRLREEDPEGAVRDYTEAIRLNPNFHEAYCNRGIARQKLGRCDEAREDYLQAQSLDSGYSDASRRLQLLDGIDPGHLPGQRC